MRFLAATSWSKCAICALFAVGLLGATPAAFSQAAPPPPEHGILAVVAVNSIDRVHLHRGTAFHVGEGTFYTNAHVVDSRSLPPHFTQWYLVPAWATSPEDWLGPMSVICVDRRWQPAPNAARPFDVARIRVPEVPSRLPAFHLAVGAVSPGGPVRIMGFPIFRREGGQPQGQLPGILARADGRVVEVDARDEIFSIEVQSGFVQAGSSGSPVLDAAGGLVGIVYAASKTRAAPVSRVLAVSARVFGTTCN